MLQKARDNGKINGIKDILESLMLITEDTPEKQYKKGSTAAQNSKFNYTAKSIESLRQIIPILSADLNNAESAIAKINFSLLSADAQSYLQYLQDKKRYTEMLGFVRGVVLNTVAEEISKSDVITIDEEKFLKDKTNNMIQAILIMTAQQLANGKNIKELFEQTGGSDTMTAKDYLDNLRSALNGKMEEITKQE